MSSKERRKKGVVPSASAEKSNSLDWDSPSAKTGTVKRRPLSGDSSSDYESTKVHQNSERRTEEKVRKIKEPSQKWFFSPKKAKHAKPVEVKTFHNYEELDFETFPKEQKKDKCHNYELLSFEGPKLFHNYEELEFERESKIPSRIRYSKKSHNYQVVNLQTNLNHNYELLDFDETLVLDDNARSLRKLYDDDDDDPSYPSEVVLERYRSKRRESGEDVGQAVKPGSSRRVKVLSLDASQERIKFIQDFVQSKYVVYKKEKAKEESRKSVPATFEWRPFDAHEIAKAAVAASVHHLGEGKHAGRPGRCRKRLTSNGVDFIGGKEWPIDTPPPPLPPPVPPLPSQTRREEGEERRLLQEYILKPGRVSDTDSGIASPLSPGSVYGFFACGNLPEKREPFADNCCCIEDGVQIYTDWANHYLEKAKSKKRVHSLATDCSDGVLLAEVIESVTCQKIPDVNRKPKSPSQMLDNINLCLSQLRNQHVAGVEGISAQELRDGKLKAILALFFALSRHKQATKVRAQQHQQQQQEMTPNRSSSIPHKAGGVGGATSSIPLPGSALPARRCPPDKVRPVAGSSRSSSPALSMIPRGPVVVQQVTASPYQAEKTPAGNSNNGQSQKNSMLDKLKLFKTNEKPAGGNGKRTSSSSGVSSARSERSDSSISLEPNVDLKPIRNTSRLKQTRPSKPVQAKNSPNATKKEVLASKPNKTAVEVEKHASKVANLPKLVEPKVKVTKESAKPQMNVCTGIPKPTAAIKGTTKISREVSSGSFKPPVSRESSQVSLKQHRPAVAMVSPIKNEMSESSNSTSTTGPSSDSSMVCKASSESSSDQPNGKESQEVPKEEYISKENDDSLAHIKEEEREDSPGISVEPMRPLLRGYCSTLTLPSRQRHYHHKMQPDGGGTGEYCDVSLANGYLSDGEVLRSTAAMDIADGYMSEGGSVLYARRLQTMPAHLPNGSPHRLVGGGYQGSSTTPGGGGGGCAAVSNGGGLGVLTEQSLAGGRRSGGGAVASRDEPPPPPAPRAAAKQRNGAPSPSGGGGHHHHDHHGSSSGKHSSHHWKRYTDSPGVGSPAVVVPTQHHHSQQQPPPPAPGSPPAGRRKGSPHGGGKDKGGAGGNKGARGVPQSFGYVKRNGSNGVINGGGGGQTTAHANGQIAMQVVQSQPGKAQTVSVVPRTKVKVSGGTQTCSSDLQQSHKSNPPAFKSYSLTGNTANQLSQSVRERLLLGSQSLPKAAIASGGVVHHVIDYGPVLRSAQAAGQAGGRPKASDGSLSDTQAIESAGSAYAPWLRHSNTYSVAPRLSETDSMESLTSLPSHRSSLTHTRLLRDSPSRLSRSNSIRSTKSEKLYPSMLHRNNGGGGPAGPGGGVDPGDAEPYYCVPAGSALSHWSQPTSPAPAAAGRTFPLSPTHQVPGGRHSTSAATGGIPKNDDIHGSSISLVSTASSLYSSAEEKQAHEIRKLRRELQEAQEKVHTLTSQLSTNAHVVSAFEQSLTSMTQRLQHLTATSEKKDAELQELRQAMDSLRAQSLQAGIGGGGNGGGGGGLARQPSSDSVSSLSSACSLDKQQHDKKKKKGWLRSSFTKAFSRNAKVTKVQCQHPSSDGSCPEGSERGHSPPPPPAPATDPGREVAELQKQLREKDLVLTDIRLEALSSAHQLESLKDTVMKMRSEMLSLKQNNERLQRMVSGGAPPGGVLVNGNSSPVPSTPNLSSDLDGRRNGSMDALCDLVPTVEEPPPEDQGDGRRVAISVYLGQPQSFDKYYAEHYGYDGGGGQCVVGLESTTTTEISIAYTTIGAVTSWPQLDNAVRRAFKQYVARLDPGGGLGLGSDAIASYKLGEAERKPDRQPPDLLPVGYAVGRVGTVHVVLQPVAALAFEALIPKGVAQRLVSLLAEHRRLVLCGAPGTGKTHLATRLAEFHAQSLGRDPTEAVATFNVDSQSAKDLRQYLSHLSEQAAAGGEAADALPCVVVLDDLHKAGSLAEALGQLPRNLPCLIGTMAQSACSATSLQLQHGFRWVLVAPHMEPARGLLGRVLRRRLATLELERGPQPELAAILGWLPRVWQHLNAFLETHSSGDVAIGPRLFLNCPLELDAARAWFADVWNYSLAPYLREAAREGLRLYGRRAPWTDPARFVLDTYPWPGAPPHGLATIPARDVGLAEGQSDGASGSGSQAGDDGDGDPLLSMLMRLQEAANYSSPHSNDSDCNSIDSSATHNSSNVGTESVS